MNKKNVWIVTGICLIISFILMEVLDGHEKSRKNSLIENELDDPKLYQIIYVTQELETPMWNSIKKGALDTLGSDLSDYKVSVDFWGTLRPNLTDFLKTMEVAIASNVSGIIVQGMNHPDFIRLVNKATTKGIPVMTIGADSPESLRKTYVGSDHLAEGTIMAEEAVKRLGTSGRLAIVSGMHEETYQATREKGIEQVLSKHPDIKIFKMERLSQQSYATDWETNEILNQCPDCYTFLGLGSETGSGIVETIQNRAKLEDYHIFTFDDNPKTMEMVEKGLIDATLQHKPEEMGKMSMILMLKWLDGKDMPLERFHYTPIQIVSR